MKKLLFLLLLMAGGCSVDSPYFIEIICQKEGVNKLSCFRIDKNKIYEYVDCKYCEGFDSMTVTVYGLENGSTIEALDTTVVCK